MCGGESWQRRERVVPGLRGSEDPAGSTGYAVQVALHVDEEEEVVPPGRPAEIAAEARVVKARMKGHPVGNGLLIPRLQITLLEVLGDHAVELIGPALDHLVELPPGGVSVLGRELVGENREVFDGVIRNRGQRAGSDLAVVIDPF